MLDPYADDRLTPVERDLYGKVYPLIREIEAEHSVSISRLVAVNMVRRAVSEGHNIEEMLSELAAHAQHQAEHNAPRH